ncbi:cytochrome b/b6 domain-containing protein [Dethiosulfatarculus sandiegensis]|uniref:Cytochrome B561 n=1 Tax=Dethiosulfatarculus sandiegensis TaxID=1429043 RepID=A0A0D2HJM7_9BACT|nr:cytochrome b/b6 domain-containing protein [Dethiosulfatarculus sandiegensis]KIX10858.1 cytochrome B561 [Dethiosulfatarculus sandiegensis]
MATELKRVYLYSRFERFWHWVQALLIIVLAGTGFELHGAYHLLGYERAHEIHEFCAWSWFVLYAFIIFWMATTGEWRQYIPTTKRMVDVCTYYCVGIFQGKDHPVPKSEQVKHNPLQRMTYLGISLIIIPAQMITGFLYLFYNDWPAWGWSQALSLNVVALIHTILAFAFVAFLVVHIYMTSTGHNVWAHMKAMLTGWEDVKES